MIKRILFLFSVALLASGATKAQDSDFCDAVKAIYWDAPNQFRNVHGNIFETSVGLSKFHSSIKVPGTINSRFVFAMGKFYEGALCQSKKLDEVKAAYNKYKAALNDCLTPEGLNMSLLDNFTPGLGELKKVAFMPPYSKDTDLKTLNGHIALEVDYNKSAKNYTLLLFIYEH